MLHLKINVAVVKIKQNAFTLLELLTSISLSGIILFSVSYFYSQNLVNDKYQKELLYLQRETHQFLNYIQQHILHLGYQGNNRINSNFSLFERDNKRYFLDNHCLMFFYDLNNDGCLGKRKTKKSECKVLDNNSTNEISKEIFGFKIAGSEIFIYADNKLNNCIGKECQKLLGSCPDKWQKFLTKEDFKIDKLDFSWHKEPKIIRIEMKISSNKYTHISYESISYAYIINEEK